MNLLNKCKLIVKEKKSWESSFKEGHLYSLVDFVVISDIN